MDTFIFELNLDAPVSVVYRALTTAVGLRSWWTATCDVSEEVGADSTFRFGVDSIVMRLETAAPNRQVRWRCVEHAGGAGGSFPVAQSWVGSTISFQIEPQTDGGTLLRLEHAGIVPTPDHGSPDERAWLHFLKRSLKGFVEGSVGEPYGSRRAALQRTA